MAGRSDNRAVFYCATHIETAYSVHACTTHFNYLSSPRIFFRIQIKTLAPLRFHVAVFVINNYLHIMANEQLPITHTQATRAAQWLKDNFETNINDVIKGTPYSFALVAAIFCQETAQRVQLWFDDYDADTCLARCVFDASGDFPGTSRSAFPRNAAEFHSKYGDEFTDMLISEGNKMRAMPQHGDKDGWGPSHYLYKGYGLYQFDLQHVLTDELFFRERKWYSIDECLIRLISVLNSKYKGDIRECVRKYNGSGQNAENYADNVMEFVEIIERG